MQRVAQAWLVLDLTGSGTAMGMAAALQFLPIWFMAPIGGLLADRTSRRRVLLVTQTLAALLAMALGVLVVLESVQLWMVYLFAFLLGVVGSIDNPNRQAFVNQLVGRNRLTNAVAWNMVLVNAARVFGPAIAGFLIVAVGTGVCFLIDSLSYVGMIIALGMMRISEPDRANGPEASGFRIRESVGHAWRTKSLRIPFLMIALVSAFVYQFEVTLPLLARNTFHGDADVFGLMFAAMGVGAVVGGIYVAARKPRPPSTLSTLSFAMGGAVGVVTLAPGLGSVLGGLVLVGATTTGFLVEGNSLIQRSARSSFLGRMLAIHALALLGVRPIFAPAMGWLGDAAGPRIALGVGAIAAVAIAAWSRPRLVMLTPGR